MFFVFADAAAEGGGDEAADDATLFFGFDDSGFAQDAGVFGNVVLADFETFGELGDVECFFEQEFNDAPAGIIGEGFEHFAAWFLLGAHGESLVGAAKGARLRG